MTSIIWLVFIRCCVRSFCAEVFLTFISKLSLPSLQQVVVTTIVLRNCFYLLSENSHRTIQRSKAGTEQLGLLSLK